MATEFVRFENGKFKVDDNAVKTLRGLSGPVAVVAVCGRARQGKSFLLNKLVSKLKGETEGSGFAVASSYKPCTKGLWLWSKPVQRKTSDGRPYSIILIDCEGIDAFDQVRCNRICIHEVNITFEGHGGLVLVLAAPGLSNDRVPAAGHGRSSSSSRNSSPTRRRWTTLPRSSPWECCFRRS